MNIINVVVWATLLLFAIVLEIATVSLVSIWFIPGIIISLILAALNVPIVVQVIVFFIVSLICFFLTKPLAKKLKEGNKDAKTDLEQIIGSKHVVIEESLSEFTPGLIKIKDIGWSILPIDGVPLYKGDIVVVEKIEGNTLYCKKHQQSIPQNVPQK